LVNRVGKVNVVADAENATVQNASVDAAPSWMEFV
jgi:hypothetical protein